MYEGCQKERVIIMGMVSLPEGEVVVSRGGQPSAPASISVRTICGLHHYYFDNMRSFSTVNILGLSLGFMNSI